MVTDVEFEVCIPDWFGVVGGDVVSYLACIRGSLPEELTSYSLAPNRGGSSN